MRDYAPPVEELIAELKKLPGIGSKSAQRLAFHIVRASSGEARGLAEAILSVTESIGYCSVCYNITDVDPCFYCTDPLRDRSLICVLEEPHNLIAVEKTREYRGLYHVLLGVLSPLNGIGPDQLKINTAFYLSKLIKPLQVRVTRIAMGLPVGGDLDYADEMTMARALEGRRDL